MWEDWLLKHGILSLLHRRSVSIQMGLAIELMLE